MAYTPKEGNGSLFRNDKQGNEKRPDYRGDIMLGGVLYEISGWLKPMPSDASKKYLSLAGKEKQAQQQKPAQKGSKGSGFDDMSDDVPW